MSDAEPLFEGNKPYATTKKYELSIAPAAKRLAENHGISLDLLQERMRRAVTRVTRLFNVREEDLRLDRVNIEDEIGGNTLGNIYFHSAEINLFNQAISTDASQQRTNIVDAFESTAIHEVAHAAAHTYLNSDQTYGALRRYGTRDGKFLQELPALAAQYYFKEDARIEGLQMREAFTLGTELWFCYKKMNGNKNSAYVYNPAVGKFAKWLLQDEGAKKLSMLAKYNSIEDAFKSEFNRSFDYLYKKFCKTIGLTLEELNDAKWLADQRRAMLDLIEKIPEDAKITFENSVDRRKMPAWFSDCSPNARCWMYHLGEEKKPIFVAIDPKDRKVYSSNAIYDADPVKSERKTFSSIEGIFSEDGFIL